MPQQWKFWLFQARVNLTIRNLNVMLNDILSRSGVIIWSWRETCKKLQSSWGVSAYIVGIISLTLQRFQNSRFQVIHPIMTVNLTKNLNIHRYHTLWTSLSFLKCTIWVPPKKKRKKAKKGGDRIWCRFWFWAHISNLILSTLIPLQI